MNVLGLHFGHDAAVSVVVDGEVKIHVSRERHSRTKHAIALTTDEIDAALADCGVTWPEIDFVAITSTQYVEPVIGLIPGLSVRFVHDESSPLMSTFGAMLRQDGIPIERFFGASLRESFLPEKDGDFAASAYRQIFPEGKSLDWQSTATIGSLDNFIALEDWNKGLTLNVIATRSVELNEFMRRGFHHMVEVGWRGETKIGAYVNHHAAHAASSFYWSGFDRAAILTHDGFGNGLSYHSGMFWFGVGTHIYPISPHHLAIGSVYDRVALRLGLGVVGGAGKLMGLAPYGKPRFFRRKFAGNFFDQAESVDGSPAETWWQHCIAAATAAGYDLEPLGDPARVTAPINADIAASTQKLFEESYLLAVDALKQVLDNSGLVTDYLCLSGGTALNCPSNSRVFREGGFSQVSVEPGCDDSGLAIGAALFVAHNLLDEPRHSEPAGRRSPYLGVAYTDAKVEAALNDFAERVSWSRSDLGPEAAADLVENKVIALYEGRSEIGPRALGHRSILSDPRDAGNWARVNRIKGRETWRPFAPAVLEADAEHWFEGAPQPSPYMLFTAQVPNRDLPAIRHVDGSARIQTAIPGSGLHTILTAFGARTGVPVLMNTSFNGPGEPIVETPSEALSFFISSDIDVLYLEGRRVVRRS